MTSRAAASFRWRVIAITSLIAIGCVGCRAVIRPGNDTDGQEPSPAPQPPALDTVRIQFRNLSPTAVDTQFYKTDGPVEPLPEDLLLPDNLVQPGIGIGGTGILGPLSVDEITVACSDDLVVGTAGGAFLDADLGTALGTGPVRFLQAPYQFDCGATLVFEYSQTTGGYTVVLFQDK